MNPKRSHRICFIALHQIWHVVRRWTWGRYVVADVGYLAIVRPEWRH